ncbi:MAG: C-terminal target protein [Flavipsychrobacter sp.]|nr:C-terminal target protein [Flavipsychrobacter sp.]
MKQRLLKAVLVIIFSGLLAITSTAQTKYHRIEAAISKDQFTLLMKEGLSIDHYEYKDGLLKADVSGADIKLMDKRKIKITYIIRDLEKNLAAYNAKIDREAAKAPATQMRTVPTPSHFGTGGSYGIAGGVAKHFTFQEMQNELDEMRALYPDLITAKSSIGTTEQGRPLYMVKISDNAAVDENEPEIFLNAVHHAREPISMTQLIFFMWYALENYNTDKEIQTLINSSEIYIVPCLNPDGYVYNINANPAGGSMWRKNRHNNGNGTYGVDNNRNYGFRWGGSGSSGTTSSETYRGSAPFSELENQAIRNFANSHQFVSEFNYHSYGNYCIYPFSAVAVNDNPEIPLFRQLSVFLTEDNSFVYGNCQETLNYIADGEAADWAYGEQTTKGKMYGFTPEIGNSSDGFYPAASRILPLCNAMTVMNLNLLKVSTHYGLITPAPPTTISTLQGSIPFGLKNFSLYPAAYNVAVTSSSPFVTAIDGAKTISSSTIFQTTNGQFNFTLDPSVTEGTVLNFVLSTDNGYHIRYDDISIVYQCVAPGGASTTGITTTSANVSWAGISGVTDYYLSMKPASSSGWGAEVLVAASTSSSFTGLTPGTAYNWRVRSVSCSNYSTTQSFTTLGLCSTPSPSASSITASGFTLTWPAIPGASNYTVQTRLQGASTWTTSTVTTNSTIVTGLAPNRVYEFQVSANCGSGASAFSAIQTVTTTYCIANGNNNNEWIDYIKLGSISRTSGRESGGYINTGLSTNLARNGTYTITFSAGFSSTVRREYWDVYIDYNRDGDFTDAGEHEVSVNKTGAGNYTASFTVPSTATLSSTRMRVIMNRLNNNVACGTFTNAEVEDYNINISGGTGEQKSIATSDIVFNKAGQDYGESKVAVTPNPFSDQVKISLNEMSLKQTNITLRNAIGMAVYQQTVGKGVRQHTINTARLPGGVYYLVIENDEMKQVIKLVK